MIIVSWLVGRLAIGVGGYEEAVGWVGALLVAVSAFGHRHGHIRVTVRRLVLVTLAVASYIAFVFDGFGRLEFVALVFGTAIAGGSLSGGRRLKAAMLVVLIPGLYVLGASRAGGGRSIDFDSDYDGLGSIVGPLDIFAGLIEGGHDGAHGRTLLGSATLWVPSAVWPDKPVAFGRELAYVFRPELVDRSSISLASLFGGEWYWNFGWLGPILAVPALALFLRLLDRALAGRLARPVDDPPTALRLLTVVVAVSAVSEMFWAGSNSYASRLLGRMIVLAAIFGVTVVFRQHRSPERIERHPRRPAVGLGEA